jgi:hypothetical protein
MNVVTSLLELVIVSHLSPKGSGRFRWYQKPIGLAVDHNHDLKSCLNKKLKKLAPKKKIQKKTTNQGCQTEKKKKKAPLALPPQNR